MLTLMYSKLIQIFLIFQILLYCRPILALECKAAVAGSLSVNFSPAVGRDKPATVSIQDPDSRFFASGSIERMQDGRNYLSTTIITKSGQDRPQLLRGKQALIDILREFSNQGVSVDAFHAHWQDHLRDYQKKPSDNFVSFMKSYRNALISKKGNLDLPKSINHSLGDLKTVLTESAVQAAWETWTGQQMRSLGFNHIERIRIKHEIGERGIFEGSEGAISISVIWSKSTDPQAITKLDDPQTISHGRPYDGSSLPALHDLITKYFAEPK